jgi:LuxR family maltose regulon positive regulatory protein
LVVEAVSHALLAGEVDRVARLVEKNAVPLMNRGELATLMRWIDALPESRVRANPWLSIARIWAFIYAGSTTGVEPLIREVEGELRDSGREDEDAERERVAGHVAAIRAYLAYLAGNAPRAVQLSSKALQLLPEKDADMRGFLMGLLATMLRWSDDIAGSMETLNRAIAIGRSAGDSLATVEALCEQGMLRGAQGRLHEAFAIYREALEVAEAYAHRVGRQLPITGYVHTRMSQILRQWNDLESAGYHIQRGIELCEQWGQLDTSLMVYIGQTLFLCALGDRKGALDACRRVKQIAEGQSPWYRLYVNCFEAQLQLALGNVCAAVRWAEQGGFGVDDELEYVNEFVYITLSRVLIAQGRFDEALYLLERLLSITQEAGRTDRVIVLRVLQAIALGGKGQAGRAVDALEQALSLAEPEGYVRVFVDEGAPMVALLESVFERGRFAAYAQALLNALQPAPVNTPAGPSPLVEPLSEREREVLEVLALGHSNREIAESLGIATGTVKNHLKNVYGKLGVHSRTQAVRRAIELDILELG